MKRPMLVAALLTPLNEDETIDVESLGRLIDWTLESGVEGLFMGGTIGEGAALRDSARRTLFGEAVRAARGRAPVLANVSETGSRRCLEQARSAERAGVSAVVATPRFGLPQRRPGETIGHVRDLAEATDLPVWFYENPHTTGVDTSFERMREIAAIPSVVGIKFSSPNRDLFTRCVRDLPETSVMTGNTDEIAYAGSIGAGGAVCGIASLLPGLSRRILDAAAAGRAAEAEALQAQLIDVYRIYGGEGWPLWPTAQKYALKRRGVLRTCVATAPFLPLREEDERAIDAVLDTLDPAMFDPA